MMGTGSFMVLLVSGVAVATLVTAGVDSVLRQGLEDGLNEALAVMFQGLSEGTDGKVNGCNE
jgi:hypothetical protein